MTEIRPFEKKIWLSSPTMHGEEQQFVQEAFDTNWVSTVGKNIDCLEEAVAGYTGMKYGVALASGTAALHLCVKLAARRLYPDALPGNALAGKKVFCSDMTFAASVNPVVYESGTPVFIDSEPDTWNMDPDSLKEAFDLYPETRLVILVHLYGVPAKMDEIMEICRQHDALLIEDAAEALGASYQGKTVSGKCGSFGDYVAISFNGNKIVTGSSGGMFLTNDKADADRVRKWSTQSRETAPWYQHEELGYNYRMSNIVAGVARGNMLHIDEHLARKRQIYERYRDGLMGLPVSMNPSEMKAAPNDWLSCLLIDPAAMCRQVRDDKEPLYLPEPGKSCPTEILEVLARYNAEGRPIWKPMHMQPIYRNCPYVSAAGDCGEDIFHRGLCLPSDNKMTPEAQAVIIELIKKCFA